MGTDFPWPFDCFTGTDWGHSYLESENLDFSYNGKNAVVTGLSIGLLAAAAASAARNIGDLVEFGAESVRIAFRLGSHVYGFSELLSPREESGSRESWAYVVMGLSYEQVQEEVDRFNADTVSFILT